MSLLGTLHDAWNWVPTLVTSFALFNSTLSSPKQSPFQSDLQFRSSLDLLNITVQGRLFHGAPLAAACANSSGSEECHRVQKGYLDETFRSSVPGGFINTQWETCQATGDQCLLDYTKPNDTTPITRTCKMGSISSYYIDVKSVTDVQAAFLFSKITKTPTVIKNTGHDYKGRSSAPGSLALWTHNLKDIALDRNFRPDGCSTDFKTVQGVTLGAGVQWQDTYGFAETHNITLVGGSDRSVGSVGGWLQGGGHGMLSNTMGLGVDRVLQYKVVTPEGHHLTANACQNQDLFFALRGGGGGTFGVVMESTILASPQVTIQMAFVTFKDPQETRTRDLWTTMTSNAVQWAKDGWGGIATSQIAIYINSKLTSDEASKSMTPLFALGKRWQSEKVNGAVVMTKEFKSWGQYFEWFASTNVAASGVSLALGSRLIDRGSLETPEKQAQIVDALVNASKVTPRLIMHSSAPFSTPGDGLISVNDAWRSSVYHITVISSWNWNATVEDKRNAYRAVTKSMDYLRKLTPDAAYVNEADVYEAGHEKTFWGSHYDRLLEIKRKFDPHQLLDCWHCVGWQPSSARFSCYL